MSMVADHLPRMRQDSSVELLTCVQRAGDVLYVPALWGHACHNEAPLVAGVAMEFFSKAGDEMIRLRQQLAQSLISEKPETQFIPL